MIFFRVYRFWRYHGFTVSQSLRHAWKSVRGY